MTHPVAAQEIDLAMPEGRINVWRFAPEGQGPWPAVMLLMDAPGLRPELHRMSERIAAQGYLVWLPNLYWRIGREVSVGPTRHHPDEAANLATMMGYIRTLDNPRVLSDLQRLVGHLHADALWNRSPIGLTGYCMSGRFAVLAAASMPEAVACAASYYGTRLVTDDADSPHRHIGHTRGELYFAFADHDPYAPPAVVQALREALAATPVRHRIEVYPGTEHGFVFSDRGSFNEQAAERHWLTLFELLGRHLQPPARARAPAA